MRVPHQRVVIKTNRDRPRKRFGVEFFILPMVIFEESNEPTLDVETLTAMSGRQAPLAREMNVS